VSLTCGQTTLRQVNLPGQLDTFSFNATGGDQTTIRLTARSGAYSPFVEMSLESVAINIFPQLDQDLLDQIRDSFGHIRFPIHARTASPPSLPISP
jgi:hypothetical protein